MVEAELEELEQQVITERVDVPTPWLSQIAVAPQAKNPKKMHTCVDMREASMAIRRKCHTAPKTDDINHTLNGSILFSRLDLNKGYHQLKCDPESRYVTMFSTRTGLQRYKLLSFGISLAAEVFQEAFILRQHFLNLH